MNSVRYTCLIFIIFTITCLISIIYLTGDIEISLYYVSAIFIGILGFMLVTRNPLLGLLLIILINHFDDLFQLPISLTAGRIVGVTVALGWFFKYFYRKKTFFFQLMDLNKFLLLLVSFMVISSLLSFYPGRSLIMVFTIFLLILMVFFIQDFISDKKKLNLLIITIALSVGIASLVGIIQYESLLSGNMLTGHVAYEGEEQIARVSGFQKNPNGYGILLMSGIPLLLFLAVNANNSILRKVSTFFFLTSIVSLAFTMSRTHIIGFIIFFLIYISLNFKHTAIGRKQFMSLAMVLVLLIAIISIFLFNIINQRSFSPGDITHEARYDILLKGIKYFMKYPLFGIGFRNFELLDRVDARFGFIYGRPGHEIISELFVCVGLFGSILFIVLCYKTLRYFNETIKSLVKYNDKYLLNLIIVLKAAFVALLCTFFGDSIILQRIFWIYIALGVTIHRWIKYRVIEL